MGACSGRSVCDRKSHAKACVNKCHSRCARNGQISALYLIYRGMHSSLCRRYAKDLQMPVIKNNDINPAVVGPAFLGIVGGDGGGIGEAGNLETFFIKADTAQILQHTD